MCSTAECTPAPIFLTLVVPYVIIFLVPKSFVQNYMLNPENESFCSVLQGY